MAKDKKVVNTAAKAKPKKKKRKITNPNGIAHVHSTMNNTIVSISDEQGNVIC
jgi:small subunit ribosomal protein S11